jgi:hypothetical protein
VSSIPRFQTRGSFLLVGLAVAFAGAACASSGSDSSRTVVVTTTIRSAEGTPRVPPPPIAKLLPPNYRARKVWRANLTGGLVPEAVVTSVGPPTGQLNFHPASIQVLAWDALAKRWTVIFDGQEVIAQNVSGSPTTSNSGPGWRSVGSEERRPILDPEADVTVDRVRFASLLPGQRKQLIFSATLNYGGSGVPSTLVVVDFEDARANVLYTWYGEDLEWRLQGGRVSARSSYWTPADAHCCPSRSYAFTIGNEGGYITVLEDERPYLGVLVRKTGGSSAVAGPLEVIEVEHGSPAAGSLRVGDVLLDVQNAPDLETQDPAAAESIFSKLSALDAVQTARLLVSRDGVEQTIEVTLGSLSDASGGLVLPVDDYSVDAL